MMEDIPVSRPSIFFDVQKIVGVSKGAGDIINYQVQWAPVWISSTHLVGCEHLISEFYESQSSPDPCREIKNNISQFSGSELSRLPKNTELNFPTTSYPTQKKNVMSVMKKECSSSLIGNNTNNLKVKCESDLPSYEENEDNVQVVVIDPQYTGENSSLNQDIEKDRTVQNRNFEWVEEKVTDVNDSKHRENGTFLFNEELIKNDMTNISHHFPDINIEETILVEPAEPELFYNAVDGSNCAKSLFGSLKCSSCKMTFDDSKELKIHQRNSHGPESKNHSNDEFAMKKVKNEREFGNIFSCHICSKTFLRESSLLSHTCRLSCPHCGKFFPSKRNLLRHIRVHTGEKPFKCDVCGLRFSRKDYLKTHLDSHISEHINNNV